MASKTKRIEEARKKIASLVTDYGLCAQNIDLSEEDDFDDFLNQLDNILETLLEPK